MKLLESHITDISPDSLQGKPWFILCAVLGDVVRRRVCLLGDNPREGHYICAEIRREILFLRGMGHADRKTKTTPYRPRLTDSTRGRRSQTQTYEVSPAIQAEIQSILAAHGLRGV
jgi:hypothetical protein